MTGSRIQKCSMLQEQSKEFNLRGLVSHLQIRDSGTLDELCKDDKNTTLGG